MNGFRTVSVDIYHDKRTKNSSFRKRFRTVSVDIYPLKIKVYGIYYI